MPRLPKPLSGAVCTGCSYCCTVEPCELAREFLHCTEGPCVALEAQDGRTICGLVRNPLGYIFKAVHPHAEVPLLDEPLQNEQGFGLSVQFAAALGFGKGCDAMDDADSERWNSALAPK